MNSKTLQKLGLTEKQATVYLACLEIGNGSAQRIAEHSNVPKSTVYDILDQLIKKRLVTVYLKKTRKRYSPVNPAIFQKRVEKQHTLLENLLPELEALYSEVSQKPRVQYLEGKTGVRTVLKEMLKEASEIFCIASPDIMFNKLSEYFPDFALKRAKKKIPISVIVSDSPLARQRQAKGLTELRKVKIIKTDRPFETVIYIWKNKVCTISLGTDLMVLIVENKEHFRTFKSIFNLLWDSANESGVSADNYFSKN